MRRRSTIEAEKRRGGSNAWKGLGLAFAIVQRMQWQVHGATMELTLSLALPMVYVRITHILRKENTKIS